MNIKFLLFCLAVLLMACTETTNAYRKREWRKKQEEFDPEKFQDFIDFLSKLEQMAKDMEDELDASQG